MSGLPPVYIVSAARTPIGSFLGYVVTVSSMSKRRTELKETEKEKMSDESC